jgi:DNA-binding MarR family transcriptional regulator
MTAQGDLFHRLAPGGAFGARETCTRSSSVGPSRAARTSRWRRSCLPGAAHRRTMSSPSREQLAAWRIFLECAFALIDILDDELQSDGQMTLRWYDVLVHLEEAEHPVRMNELASRILASKSGLTRVIDRMEEAGLVRRERPIDDRRVIEVVITPQGLNALQAGRLVHRRGIDEHFAQQLNDRDFAALTRALEKVRDHVRPLRPGRISG